MITEKQLRQLVPEILFGAALRLQQKRKFRVFQGACAAIYGSAMAFKRKNGLTDAEGDTLLRFANAAFAIMKPTCREQEAFNNTLRVRAELANSIFFWWGNLEIHRDRRPGRARVRLFKEIMDTRIIALLLVCEMYENDKQWRKLFR